MVSEGAMADHLRLYAASDKAWMLGLRAPSSRMTDGWDAFINNAG
jgi:hypothetical protein